MKITTTIQKAPKFSVDNNNYSQSYQNTQPLEKRKEGLRIVAIPYRERRGMAFFRIIDDFGLIIADQLSDWQKSQRYFEREEVSKNA